MGQFEEAKKRLGEHFIMGIAGKTLHDDSAAFISQAGIGGIIFFAHNYESPEQLGALVNQIQECRTDLPLWIAVDQEGGRVQRFKTAPFTRLPTASAVGKNGSPRHAFELAQVCAKELKAVGVNLNLAPVADILSDDNSPGIGDRSFGSDEELVTRMVTASVRGHVTVGVQPCVKHFPGHGSAKIDSHEDLPHVDTTLDELREREFKPFVKTFKSRCNMVLVAHILNKNIDPKYPASLSQKTLKDLLRGEMRYSRIIISDDLEMGAVVKHFAPEEVPVLALQATCDLLIYRTEAAARKAYESALKGLDDGAIDADFILNSANALRELKQELLLPYEPLQTSAIAAQLGTPEHLKIAQLFE